MSMIRIYTFSCKHITDTKLQVTNACERGYFVGVFDSNSYLLLRECREMWSGKIDNWTTGHEMVGQYAPF